MPAVIHFAGAGPLPRTSGEAAVEVKEGPGPIVPELKELAWGAGAFVVFAILMRFVLFPRLKKGMDARYSLIRSNFESADGERAAATAELADYEAQLAQVRAEAAARVDAARQQLEAERQAALAQSNEALASRRAGAMAEVEAARAATRGQLADAVRQVAGAAGQIVTGRRPSDEIVERAVNEVMAR